MPHNAGSLPHDSAACTSATALQCSVAHPYVPLFVHCTLYCRPVSTTNSRERARSNRCHTHLASLFPTQHRLVSTPDGSEHASNHGSGADVVFLPRNQVQAGRYLVTGEARAACCGLHWLGWVARMVRVHCHSLQHCNECKHAGTSCPADTG